MASAAGAGAAASRLQAPTRPALLLTTLEGPAMLPLPLLRLVAARRRRHCWSMKRQGSSGCSRRTCCTKSWSHSNDLSKPSSSSLRLGPDEASVPLLDKASAANRPEKPAFRRTRRQTCNPEVFNESGMGMRTSRELSACACSVWLAKWSKRRTSTGACGCPG